MKSFEKIREKFLLIYPQTGGRGETNELVSA